MTENRKLDRIRKLLAQAEGAGTPEEAETFAVKAEQLMAQYSIDAAMLAATTRAHDPIGTRQITLNGYPIPKSILLAAIAANMNCRVLLTSFPGRSGVKLATVCGHESDLEAFDILATSLLLQATTAATATHKRAPHINGRTFRHNFLLGFAARVADRMTQARSAATPTTPRATLVLRDRRAAVDDHIEAEHSKLGTTKTRMTHARSYLAGDAAAQQADLNHRARVASDLGRPMLHS